MSKHYYIESDRIVSKIGGGFKNAPYDIFNHVYDSKIQSLSDYQNKSDSIFLSMMPQHFDSAYVYDDVLVDMISLKNIYSLTLFDKNENDIFWYHKDHLGSSTQITDRNETVIHHMEYMPSGELFAEQRDTWGTPFKFNSKELDQETGLYYYGARYYSPYLSIWASVDPMSDKYPHQSNYMYCSGRLVNVIDPDGRDEWEVSPSGKVKWIAENKEKDVFYSTDKKGNKVSSKEFQYGTIENLSSGKEDGINHQVLRVRGDNQAKELFEFLSTPENFNLNVGQNVEWSRFMCGVEGDKGLNFLTTSWEKDREAGSHFLFKNQLKYGYTIRGYDHNHPNNNDTPSGTGGKGGDIAKMKEWKREGNVSPNAQFRIFTPGLSKKYHPYNEKSTYKLKTCTIIGNR